MARLDSGAPITGGTMAKALIRIVTCGSVDDGKSTLLGRLLAETDSLPTDLVEAARFTRRPGSAVPVGEVDYSLVTDGLEAERDQGITIDVAYRHLYLPSGRRAIFADAPGHEQYTRNMAVAASTADAAILLADALRGSRDQTHRHLSVCALMGVRHLLVAVNKMDAVDWDRGVFDAICEELRASAARHGIDSVVCVPTSALTGANVTSSRAAPQWYDGPSLLQAIDAMEVEHDAAAPLRMPPGVNRIPFAVSQATAAGRSSIHRPTWLRAGSCTFGLFPASMGCIRSTSTRKGPSPATAMSSSTFSRSL